MNIEILPLFSFVIVTTFTPGPNNISSASMGVLFGYRRSLSYLAGIAAGFFFVMLLCAYVSGSLLRIMPSVEPVLRVVGAGYILWLALGTARASYAFRETDQPPMKFKKGFFLQAFNPKVAVYGLTLYSTFLAAAVDSPVVLSLSALLFAATAFCATSTWALCGAAIRRHLREQRVRMAVNAVLVLLLLYSAAELSGLSPLAG